MFNDMLEDFMRQIHGTSNINAYNHDHLIDEICPNPDNMTYEQLLELQEKIGFVSKGLSQDEKKVKFFYYFAYGQLLKYKILENSGDYFQ